MAKTYYTLEETLEKLGCTKEQLRNFVLRVPIREFRDAGKLKYLVEEIDRLAAEMAGPADSTGGLSLAETGELALAPEDSGEIKLGGSDSGLAAGSGIDLGGSTGLTLEDTDAPGLAGTGSLSLADSTPPPPSRSGSGTGKAGGSGSAILGLVEDDAEKPPAPAGRSSAGSVGGDMISLDEVDSTAVEGLKKDDTVITNIGISVFEDADIEIAADPMAKTMLTSGEDEHAVLEGSGGGSGLLDLTRESDDTSLGAELLEGIDMGDTAETVAPTAAGAAPEPAMVAEVSGLPAPGPEVPLALGPAVVSTATVPAASPAFTGLLIAAAISLTLAGAASIATSMGAWPAYLDMLAGRFWFFLLGTLATGGLCAGIGWFVGRPPGPPRPPKAPKAPKATKGKKGAASAPEAG